MGVPLTYTESLVTDTCLTCGISFAYPTQWKRQRHEDHLDYHCPNGHKQHFTEESDAERAVRLERELSAEKAKRWEAENQKNASDARLVRLKRRVANGVCPCCKRSFANLRRHMTVRHPEVARAK